MPYTFTVRPGYGSDDLLIEFGGVSDRYVFVETLQTELQRIDATETAAPLRPAIVDELLIEYDSPHGPFEFSMDIWDLAFIHAPDNQDAIDAIADVLRDSSNFSEEAVDFSEYR